MESLLAKLTERQLWALIVLLEGQSGLRHSLKDNQSGSPPFRVDGADRG
jgi:hypothetical protein